MAKPLVPVHPARSSSIPMPSDVDSKRSSAPGSSNDVQSSVPMVDMDALDEAVDNLERQAQLRAESTCDLLDAHGQSFMLTIDVFFVSVEAELEWEEEQKAAQERAAAEAKAQAQLQVLTTV